METQTALIIGAGPAGLTAAYELLTRTSIKPIVFETLGQVGGISRTLNHQGNRIDIGGHRFFSKSDRVMDWWLAMLPLESAPDAASSDRVMLLRQRKSRIYFLRKFFDYPISLTLETLTLLGLARTVRITLSYLFRIIHPIKPERNLEDFFINRFGRALYSTFFESYTEKVWGLPCRDISPEWGAQRIKGLSIFRAIAHFLKRLVPQKAHFRQKNVETSLIEEFLYPKYGPGQLWEEAARKITDLGGEIHCGHEVVRLEHDGGRIAAVHVKNLLTGDTRRVTANFFFSTMPIKDLIQRMDAGIPEEVRHIASGLVYRDFITVGLLVSKLLVSEKTDSPGNPRPITDNWIYVQEPEVKLGRIQFFNNWSPWLVKDPKTTWLGLEYFCNEGDDLWNKTDADMAAFAAQELASIGFIHPGDVLDQVVVRVPKTYPAYFGAYANFHIVRAFTDSIANLFLIGRNGMHRYNNQDHSMLTAMTAVDNILNGICEKDNLWSVNTEQEYHEAKETSAEPPPPLTAVDNITRAYEDSGEHVDMPYDPDAYWGNTVDAYPHYPTVRHRKRFVLRAVRKETPLNKKRIFDYGCGEGGILRRLADLGVPPGQLAGCDISTEAIARARASLPSATFYAGRMPKREAPYDIVICSEVIEHTPQYREIIRSIAHALAPKGLLILTTQSGPIHASDRYTGHTQHFELDALCALCAQEGFEIAYARRWGFPCFSLQKRLTNRNFQSVKNNYLEGKMSWKKRVLFSLAYAAYFLHDAIPAGPQIYLLARRTEALSTED